MSNLPPRRPEVPPSLPAHERQPEAPARVTREEIEPPGLHSPRGSSTAFGAEAREQPTIDADTPAAPLKAFQGYGVRPDGERGEHGAAQWMDP